MKKLFSLLLGLFIAISSLFVSCDEKEIGQEKTICTVTVKSAGNGSVEIANYIGTSANVAIGDTVVVVATPDRGYDFIGWFVEGTDECVSDDATYVFTAFEDITLVADFEKEATNVYEAVDLGLSVKWATCNVGATKPEEYGGYYAWGETEEKDFYDWSTYKWCNGGYDTMTKYCIYSDNGTVDNKTVLDPEDDVVHVKWGGSWRMPTRAEQDELCANCTWTWTTQNGVNGYKVTSKTNGNSIFLPAAGLCDGTTLRYSGSNCYYWLSSLFDGSSRLAYYLDFSSGDYDWYGSYRYYGFTVRPVSE